MKKPNESMALLDMFMHPAFRVKDGIICDVNSYAAHCRIVPGTSVDTLITYDKDVYNTFDGSCLSLCVSAEGVDYIATVYPTADGDIFHLQNAEDSPELRVMTLAAQQLRSPLSEIMSATNRLFAKEEIQETAENREQAGIINKGLYQLLREIGNMSAASSYRQGRIYGKETKNIVSVINETMEKAQALCNTSAQRLVYAPLCEDIYCVVDSEMLERAVYNLISNALKFSPGDSLVTAKLTAGQDKLRFCVESEITDSALTQKNLFLRYVREADVEDGRLGLGLGIPLTQYAAFAHSGSLLMDHPDENKVRFTLTLSTAAPKEPVLSSPFPDFDYMGGLDHGLVELSDVLPATAYENL